MPLLRLFAALAATAMLCLPASAARYRLAPGEVIELPPLKYDKPYTGRLIVKHRSIPGIQRDCGPETWACAEDTRPGVCTIWLPFVSEVGWAVYLRLKQHELGHCVGWPAHHPGARS